MKIIFVSIFASIVFVDFAYGYEVHTHARITTFAYSKSDLCKGNIVQDADKYLTINCTTTDEISSIGLSLKTLLGRTSNESMYYYEIIDSKQFKRQPKDSYVRLLFPKFSTSESSISKTIPDWLLRGAVREDDIIGFDYPNDDPSGNFWRVFHHFYDPVNNTGLISPIDYIKWPSGGVLPQRAPDWALGYENAFTDPQIPNRQRRNHFTIVDAREAMFRALTGRTYDDTGNVNLLIGSVDNEGNTLRKATEGDRKAYWATTFRSLGDVVHLVQDMANPQHTRNDSHNPTKDGGYAADFERYINSLAQGKPPKGLDGKKLPIFHQLKFEGYPIPKFTNYSRFWHDDLPGQVQDGKGLADYSNREFFTAGTGMGSNRYNLPPNNWQEIGYTPSKVFGRADNRIGPFSYRYLIREIKDKNETSSHDEIRITRQSLWSRGRLMATYSMDYYVYDDMVDLLIPRAVAYSAGLINYFFRGRMEIAPPKDGIYALIDHSPTHARNDAGVAYAGSAIFGFHTLKIQVKDATQYNDDTLSGGQMYAVVKYRLNRCYESDLSGERGLSGALPENCTAADFNGLEEKIAVSDPAPNGPIELTKEFKEITFTFSGDEIIPVNAHSLHLQVVYRGKLGSETDAVVVATHDIAEPTYVHLINNTDYQCVNETMTHSPGGGKAFTDIQVHINNAATAQFSLPSLPVAHFYRVVMLMEKTPYTYHMTGGLPTGSRVYLPDTIQPGSDTGITPTLPFRGTYQRDYPHLVILDNNNCKGYGDGTSDWKLLETMKDLEQKTPLPVAFPQ